MGDWGLNNQPKVLAPATVEGGFEPSCPWLCCPSSSVTLPGLSATGSHRPHLTGLEPFLASRTLPGPTHSFPRAGCPTSPGQLLSGPPPSLTDTIESSGPRPSTAGQPLSSLVVCDLAIHNWLRAGTYHSSTTTQSAPRCLEVKRSCPGQRLLSPALCRSRLHLPPRLQPAQPAQPRGCRSPETAGPEIPHQPQREIHKSNGFERTKLSHQSITDPDLNNTRPEACQL